MRGLTSRGQTPLVLRGRLRALLNFKGTPHELALAFGIGIAIGIIPGTGGIAAAAVATILRLNLPIMVAGALLTNPVTAPFVYTGSYLMGDWLAGEWLPTGTLPRLLAGTVVGNLVLAVSLGIAGYLLVFGVMKISK